MQPVKPGRLTQVQKNCLHITGLFGNRTVFLVLNVHALVNASTTFLQMSLYGHIIWIWLNSECQMCFAHVIMTYKTNNSQLYIRMMSCLLIRWHANISPLMTVCQKTRTLYTSPYVPLPTLWMSSKSCWGFLLWISPLGRGKISMVARSKRHLVTFSWLWWNLMLLWRSSGPE